MDKVNRNKTTILLVAILVVVIGAGVVFRQPIKNQLNDWKLLPEPEKLTELYFNNSANLPTTYIPGVTQTFSFTVHNLEYQTMNYHYTITALSSNNVTSTITSGAFTLNQNQYKSVPISFAISDLGQRVQIGVNLANPSQSIDYWVNRSGS